MIYMIGSLRNPKIPAIAETLRDYGHEVFDDWFAAGPFADDAWQRYEVSRGHTYVEALEGIAARHVYLHDWGYLRKCDVAVLVAPAGKSAHMEMGWMLGQGKKGYVLLDGEPERFDVMLKLTDGVVYSVDELIERLK